MKLFLHSIKNKQGFSYITTAVWIIALCMTLSAILSYASMMVMIQTAKQNTGRVLDGFATKNSIEIYNLLINGKRDLNEFFTSEILFDELGNKLSLERKNATLHFKSEDGTVLYRITEPVLSYEIDDPKKENPMIRLTANYNIIFPITFSGNTITNLLIPQKVDTYFVFKERTDLP